MGNEYRNEAKSALDRARQTLAAGRDCELRYAALELRMALECLVYERAQGYREELSSKKLNTWQPKQLLNILLTIDPHADQTSSIRFGVEKEFGVPAEEMTYLGTDRVISLKEIKEYYDRLGSYLHAPTIDQVRLGKGLPGQKLRKSCEDLSNIIGGSLKSKVWNVNFKVTTSLDCEDCGTKIVRRVQAGKDQFDATCIECEASYILTRTADDKFTWKADNLQVACANPACEKEISVWRRDIAVGKYWKCQSCDGKNEIIFGLKFTPPVG